MKLEITEKFKTLTNKLVYVNGKKIMSLTVQKKSKKKIYHS
jgi:hypothetical protein